MSKRVVLCDDHQMLLNGLRSLIGSHSDMEVVGEAGDGRTLLGMLDETSPDVVVIDVTMPEMNGIEATIHITTKYPDIRVVCLSMHSDLKIVSNMIKAGAVGYVLKECAFDELIKAIRAVVCGKIYLCSEINALAIRDYYERLKQSENSSPGPLTPREREILQLLAEGERVRVIADKLCISARTVETHRRKIMDTLGLHSLAKLTKYAIMEGMTSTDIRNGLDNR